MKFKLKEQFVASPDGGGGKGTSVRVKAPGVVTSVEVETIEDLVKIANDRRSVIMVDPFNLELTTFKPD